MRWYPDGDFWRLFCVLCFQRAACSTFQTCILNSHYGHTMCGSMVDIQSPTAEIRRGKKERKKKIEITGQIYNGLPYTLFHRATITRETGMRLTEWSRELIPETRWGIPKEVFMETETIKNTINFLRDYGLPYIIGQTIIFLPCDFYLLLLFLVIISAVGDWKST